MPSCTLTGKTYVHIIHSGNQEQIKKVKFVNASADFLLHYLVLTMFEKKSSSAMKWYSIYATPYSVCHDAHYA